MYRFFPLLMLSFLIGGCAFTQANLNINYDESMAKKGPLSSLEKQNIKVGDFIDKRPETDKIGYKRNGFGQKTAKITSQKPVPEVIREALITMIDANGHSVGLDGDGVNLSGTVTDFWFDTQINFWTIEFFGTVGIDMAVSDMQTGKVLINRSYIGHYREESMGGLEGTWERVMNKALEDMILQIGTDPQLIEALKDRQNMNTHFTGNISQLDTGEAARD